MLYLGFLLLAGILQGVMVSLNAQMGNYFSLFGICFFVHAINALAPTCSVHQLEVATIPIPIAPTRYTYHGAPENRSGCRLTSR